MKFFFFPYEANSRIASDKRTAKGNKVIKMILMLNTNVFTVKFNAE